MTNPINPKLGCLFCLFIIVLTCAVTLTINSCRRHSQSQGQKYNPDSKESRESTRRIIEGSR